MRTPARHLTVLPSWPQSYAAERRRIRSLKRRRALRRWLLHELVPAFGIACLVVGVSVAFALLVLFLPVGQP